jgi:hypothetical protein
MPDETACCSGKEFPGYIQPAHRNIFQVFCMAAAKSRGGSGRKRRNAQKIVAKHAKIRLFFPHRRDALRDINKGFQSGGVQQDGETSSDVRHGGAL